MNEVSKLVHSFENLRRIVDSAMQFRALPLTSDKFRYRASMIYCHRYQLIEIQYHVVKDYEIISSPLKFGDLREEVKSFKADFVEYAATMIHHLIGGLELLDKETLRKQTQNRNRVKSRRGKKK